jgi:hypothetical protein
MPKQPSQWAEGVADGAFLARHLIAEGHRPLVAALWGRMTLISDRADRRWKQTGGSPGAVLSEWRQGVKSGFAAVLDDTSHRPPTATQR